MFSTKELIIAIPAFVGMGLGLYNLVRDILGNRVNLKVVPKSVVAFSKDEFGNTVFKWSPHSFKAEHNSDYLAVEIINQGNVTVTIDSVGFFAKGDKTPLQIYKPMPVDRGTWPRRLESHESVTIVGSLPDFLAAQKSKNVITAFAETQSGIICKGTSKALQEIVQHAKSA